MKTLKSKKLQSSAKPNAEPIAPHADAAEVTVENQLPLRSAVTSVERQQRQLVFDWAKPDRLRQAESFFAKYAAHSALKQHAIYALPGALIDSLCKAGMLGPEDEEFERDLTAASGVGFFLGRRIACSLTLGCDSSRVSDEQRAVQEREIGTTRSITDLLSLDLERHGVKKEDIAVYFDEDRKWGVEFEEMRLGYAGWLATEPAFRKDVLQLQTNWEDRVLVRGHLPTITISLFGESGAPIPISDREMYSDFMKLYRRWGLERLATWELPIPLSPGLTLPSLYHKHDQEEMGFTSFIPWYFLREKGLNFQEFARHRALGSVSDHLKNWFEPEPKNWGQTRYEDMLRLWLFLELAFKRRYREQLQRNIGKFEEAFLSYLIGPTNNASTENIRKIRQKMYQRIDNGW